jgi:hypothetical protein
MGFRVRTEGQYRRTSLPVYKHKQAIIKIHYIAQLMDYIALQST